jgi:hypothetical protein
MFVHSQPGNYSLKYLSDFTVAKINSFFTREILEKYQSTPTNLLIWTSKKQPDNKKYFPEELKTPSQNLSHDILLVYSDSSPDSLTLSGIGSYYDNLAYKIIGMLPGKTRPGEVIMFSAHYDHEGVSPLGLGDTILNGANDDASGVVALLALAKYFSLKNNNDRTIMFCAFAGEEL